MISLTISDVGDGVYSYGHQNEDQEEEVGQKIHVTEKANRLDPNPFTQLLLLCLHFMTKNKNVTLNELCVPNHYESLRGLRYGYNLSTHQVSAP